MNEFDPYDVQSCIGYGDFFEFNVLVLSNMTLDV
jgi:hypothetical protein